MKNLLLPAYLAHLPGHAGSDVDFEYRIRLRNPHMPEESASVCTAGTLVGNVWSDAA